MPPDDFWVAQGEGWTGPFPLREVARQVAEGRLDPGAPVWRRGWTAPVAAAEVLREAEARARAPATLGELLAEYLSPAQFGALVRSPRFWALYSLAAFPLLVLALEPSGTATWMFVYFSLVWAVLFFRLVQPEPGTVTAAIWVYLLTVAVAMPLLVVWLSLPPRLTEAFLEAGGLFRLGGFVLGVGVREEVTKLLPLLWMFALSRRSGGRLSLRQGIALGAVAGFAFAAAENVEYLRSFEAWDRLSMRYGVFSRTSLDASLVRMSLTPFMHGAWAGIAGYFAAWGEWNPALRWRLRAAGLLGAALLHGVYDTVAPFPVLCLLVVAFTFHVFTRCVARAANEASGVAALERGVG